MGEWGKNVLAKGNFQIGIYTFSSAEGISSGNPQISLSFLQISLRAAFALLSRLPRST